MNSQTNTEFSGTIIIGDQAEPGKRYLFVGIPMSVVKAKGKTTNPYDWVGFDTSKYVDEQARPVINVHFITDEASYGKNPREYMKQQFPWAGSCLYQALTLYLRNGETSEGFFYTKGSDPTQRIGGMAAAVLKLWRITPQTLIHSVEI